VLAREYGVPVVPHAWGTPVALAATLHFVSTLPDTPWLEFDRSPNPLREDLSETPPTPAGDGRVPVPDGPGLGVDIDSAAIERYRVD
jgi:D-galactarolactone cycloisomerase